MTAALMMACREFLQLPCVPEVINPELEDHPGFQLWRLYSAVCALFEFGTVGRCPGTGHGYVGQTCSA